MFVRFIFTPHVKYLLYKWPCYIGANRVWFCRNLGEERLTFREKAHPDEGLSLETSLSALARFSSSLILLAFFTLSNTACAALSFDETC